MEVLQILRQLSLAHYVLLQHQQVLLHQFHQQLSFGQLAGRIKALRQLRQHIHELLERQPGLVLVLVVHDVVVLALLFGATDLRVEQHPPKVLYLQQAVVVAIAVASVEDEDVLQFLAGLLEPSLRFAFLL